MKRFSAMLLAALLLFSLAACSGSKQAYVPSDAIEVAVAHINGNARVVTRKISDQELASINLACVYFGADGTQLGELEKIQCDFTTEGTLSVWSFAAPAGSTYMEAVIASVTYADGTEQPCPGVSTWADEAAKSFSVDSHNKKREQMAKKEAAAAQMCDAVEITLGTPTEGTVELGVNNTSGKEIAEVVVSVLWFDANGEPLDTEGMLVSNSGKISAENLIVDEEASYTAAAPKDAAAAKAVVQNVTFTDGTAWENNYVYEWAVTNYTSAE